MRKTMLAASAALATLIMAANFAMADCGGHSITVDVPSPNTVADGATVVKTPSSGG